MPYEGCATLGRCVPHKKQPLLEGGNFTTQILPQLGIDWTKANMGSAAGKRSDTNMGQTWEARPGKYRGRESLRSAAGETLRYCFWKTH
jgi:hypothetical protein